MEPSVAAQGTEDLAGGVDQASRELREAVIAADHTRAERASSGYVEALHKLWEALPEEERMRSPVPAKARELLDWARKMAAIQRSLAADQLRILHMATRYENAASSYSKLQIKG